MIKSSGVYKITNTINGKFYVGSSIDIPSRWRDHRREAKKERAAYRCLVHDAMRKYGVENFLFEVLEECDATKEVLVSREQHYIDLLQPVYNINPNASSRLGAKLPDGVFAWNKGIPLTEDHRQKFVYAEWTERRQKNSESHKGLEPWNRGIPQSEEARRKNSEANMGHVAWNKDMTMPEEFCQKMAEIAKANYDPQHQARMTEAARQHNTERKYSEAHCKAIGDGRRGKGSSLKGSSRPVETKQAIAEGQKNSEKCKAYHEGRVGKSRGNSNTSGQAGVIWDKSRNKWQVRFQGKLYGRFERLEDAKAKAQEVLALRQQS